MRLVACEVPELRKGCYKKSEVMELIEEFVSSEHECVRIDGWHHKTAGGCYNVFYSALKRYNVGNVIVRTSGDNVYLVKVKN